ncbi:hypothetical protein JOD45_000856 [Scopulibacillus daqui]|uniref:Uncharacterized protein n=1 Tax=Scopulibacillus daqui TaxID=1469162 RepID=A0ABS2PXF4_9BACL|nr:hypothetical protein [Scopulibacillus daqui]MBM7644663.1 hypothetical protein [Scopulibacillus daqui]
MKKFIFGLCAIAFVTSLSFTHLNSEKSLAHELNPPAAVAYNDL